MSASLELKSTTAADTSASSNGWSRLLFWTVPAVCLLYLVQLWTPLRLTGDSIVLLSMASSAADGHGFLCHGEKTQYPPGYPALVVGLERMGAARPWGLVGLNALFLLIGFASSYYVVRRYFQLSSNWAAMTLLFTALNFALIKHFTLPLTDVPFFGMSMVAVALIVRAEKEPGAWYYILLTLACLTSIAAALVRPIAIALLPSLAWSLIAHFRSGGFLLATRRRLPLVCCASTAVLAGVSVVLLRTAYVQGALSLFAQKGPLRGFRDILLIRLHEIGELALNAPASKLGSASALVWLFGAMATVLLVTCVRHCRLGVAEIYLAAYVFVMLLWLYTDTRFRTPVLPLIFAALFSSLRPWTFTGWRKQAGLLYAAAYMLMGLVALAYSTRITFSGREFPRRYGDGNIRSTYEVFYSDPKADWSRSNDCALELLQRYSRTDRQ